MCKIINKIITDYILFLLILLQASKLPLALICSIMGIILSPIVLAMLFLCSIYRFIARTILYSMYSNYRGLMDGADAYWSLEVDSSKAVINIVAFVELKSCGMCFFISLIIILFIINA